MTREEAIRSIAGHIHYHRIGECPHHGRLSEALHMAIAALREQPRWISVEERLPGTENVLITNGEFVKCGFRRPDGVWKYGAEEHMRWDRLSCHAVTHWMPLPEPPKEEV